MGGRKAAWQEAGLDDSIELRIAAALETLRALPQEAVVDLAFIDADKTGYGGYLDELVPRVRPGGVLLVDNVLWSGRVVEADVTDDDTVALRAFNHKVAADDRVEALALTTFDGLTIARKLYRPPESLAASRVCRPWSANVPWIASGCADLSRCWSR